METESISGEIFIGIAEANHVHAEKGHPRNKYVSPADLIPATMHTTTACTVEIYGVAHAPGPTYGYQCHLQREREREGEERIEEERSCIVFSESQPTGLTNHRTRSTRAPTYTPLMRACCVAMCASYERFYIVSFLSLLSRQEFDEFYFRKILVLLFLRYCIVVHRFNLSCIWWCFTVVSTKQGCNVTNEIVNVSND